MAFVKTPQECAAIQRLFARPRWLLDGVRVRFATSADFIDYVLPPCLQPTNDPSAIVSVGRWQSACCGEFDTASVYVTCTDGMDVGLYNVAMIVTGDTPVTWGREVWGEVKKRGDIGYYRGPSSVHAFAERNGVRLIEIAATLRGDPARTASSGLCFEVKAYPAANGIGLEYNPRLVRLSVRSDHAIERSAEAEVRFAGSPFDPLDTIPILSVAEAAHVVDTPIYEVVSVTELADPDTYLPYVYGRHYDDLTQFRIPPELATP